MKALSPGGGEKRIGDKIHRLAKFYGFTRGIVYHLIKTSTFTVPITYFVKQRAEETVACETRVRHDMSQEIAINEEITAPSPLKRRLPKSSNTFLNDKDKEEES